MQAFLGAAPRGCNQAVAESVIAFPRCVDTHAAISVLDDDRLGSFGCVACQSASALSSLAGSVFSNHHCADG
jgi:hypothetical protein